MIVSFVPARSSRSNCWMWKSAVAWATSRSGHVLPSQVSVMRTPLGALTVSSATSAPSLVRLPLMRTVGYGRIIFALAFFCVEARLIVPAASEAAGLGWATGCAIGTPSG